MNQADFVSQTIFCESIRNEKNGQITLVGIFPDNLALERIGPENEKNVERKATLPTLSLYTRARLPVDQPVKSDIQLTFRSPSGRDILHHVVAQDFIDRNRLVAKQQGNEYVLILQQMTTTGFPILENGRFVMTVDYGGETFFSGAIHLSVSDNTGVNNLNESVQ